MLPSDSQFPGNTAYSFDPLSDDIKNYIQRNTPEAFPFIDKVFYEYLRAFLCNWNQEGLPASDSVTGALDKLDSFYDPYRNYLVNRFLFYPLVPKFESLDLQYIINYSRTRKDLTLFYMLVGAFFDDSDALLVYGDSFRAASIAALDTVKDANTDEGYTTDMQDAGTPRFVCIIKYPYQKSLDFSMSEFLNRVRSMADFVTIVIPARIFFGIILRPEFFYGLSKDSGLVDVLDPLRDAYTDQSLVTDVFAGGDPSVYGYTVTASPLVHSDEVDFFKSMGDDAITRIYNYAEADNGAQVKVVYNQNRQKSYLVSSHTPVTKLIIKYSGGVSDFTDFEFHFGDPEGYPRVMALPVYYIRMTITFP